MSCPIIFTVNFFEIQNWVSGLQFRNKCSIHTQQQTNLIRGQTLNFLRNSKLGLWPQTHACVHTHKFSG